MADTGREFYLNYSTCEDWASKIDGKNTALRNKLEEIQRKINSLEASYESDASTTIRQKITGMTPRFQSYEEVIKGYTTFIRRTSQAVDGSVRTVDANAQQFI